MYFCRKLQAWGGLCLAGYPPTHTHPGGSARLGPPPARPLCPSQRFAVPGGCCFPPPVLQCGGCGFIGSTSQPRAAAVAAPPAPAPPRHLPPLSPGVRPRPPPGWGGSAPRCPGGGCLCSEGGTERGVTVGMAGNPPVSAGVEGGKCLLGSVRVGCKVEGGLACLLSK